jgi:hypothetical protein
VPACLIFKSSKQISSKFGIGNPNEICQVILVPIGSVTSVLCTGLGSFFSLFSSKTDHTKI